MKRRPKTKAQKDKAAEIAERLTLENPHPHVELYFDNAWQLMVAVILSAQSTDKMVNRVMPELLKRWPNPQALAQAKQEDVEEVIKSTGFFRNKGKSIRLASQVIVERHNGQVPRTMPEMLEIPGVARKSANVILGAAYGVASGIAVDTHVMRVSQRLGLTRHKTPEKIELDLCDLFPPKEWSSNGHRLVLHGRYVCLARSPKCERCPLNELCPSSETLPVGSWKNRAQTIALEMGSRGETFSRADANVA